MRRWGDEPARPAGRYGLGGVEPSVPSSSWWSSRTPQEARNALILAAEAQAARIAVLEEKLETISQELRELRRKVTS